MTRERFTALVSGEQKKLRQFLLALCCGHADEADDIAQDALVKAFLASAGMAESERLTAWIYKIAYNTFLDHKRRRTPEIALDHNCQIGVIVPELVHYYFDTVLSGIEEQARIRGYRVIIGQSHESYEREVETCMAFAEARVCGIIISLAKGTSDYSHFRELQAAGLPLVFFDRICHGINASRVVVDDYQGVYNAVCHLIATGCRRIAFFGSPTR